MPATKCWILYCQSQASATRFPPHTLLISLDTRRISSPSGEREGIATHEFAPSVIISCASWEDAMAKRVWGPFSIPGVREVGAEQRGSWYGGFLWVKWSPRMCEGRGATIYHRLLRQKLDGGKLSEPFRCPERWGPESFVLIGPVTSRQL